MTYFRKMSLPPKDKFLLFQPDILSFIQFIKGSQKFNRLTSPHIGRPKYAKDKHPILQFITMAASVNHELVTLTQTNKLLLKLTFNPGITS